MHHEDGIDATPATDHLRESTYDPCLEPARAQYAAKQASPQRPILEYGYFTFSDKSRKRLRFLPNKYRYQRHIARRLGNMTSADEAYHCTMVSTCVAWKIHTTNIQGKHYYLSAMSSSDPAAQLTYFPWLRWEAASPGIFQALTP
jgi:hypothetical protein